MECSKLAFFLFLSLCFFFNVVGTSNREGNTQAGNVTISKIRNTLESKQPKTIKASAVAPGYNGKNATACFVNAIKSARKGDTVVIDFMQGTGGIWFIEGRHPNWFDGNGGKDRVANDLTLIFEKGVTLKAMDSTYKDNSGLDMLFRLENISGWKIFGYGAKFEMNNALLPAGEDRNAIALYDCSDIHIEGLLVDGSGGDGIYIGTRSQTGFSKNITLKNMSFINHRRQGTTITSAHNVLFENINFNCTLGRPPASGLDIEPNYSSQRLTKIKFKNVEFAQNGYTGILFALSKLNDTSIPIDVELDGIYITDNWQERGALDPGYKKAAIVMGLGGGGDNAVNGTVRFNNVLIKKERFDGLFTLKHHDAYKLIFNDVVFENVGNAHATHAQYAIHTSRYNYDAPKPAVGNITFNGLLVLEKRNIPFWQMEGDSNDGWRIDDVLIKDALIVTASTQGEGMNNTTKALKGSGTSLLYSGTSAMPENVVEIKKNSVRVVRGAKAFFIVTRAADDIAYPLPVEYSISGTAENMDDYNRLHGYLIIPANKTSAEIPLHARAKEDKDETLTITLIDTPNYTLGNSISETISIVSD